VSPTSSAFDPSGVPGLDVTEAEHGPLLSVRDLGNGTELFLEDKTWP